MQTFKKTLVVVKPAAFAAAVIGVVANNHRGEVSLPFF